MWNLGGIKDMKVKGGLLGRGKGEGEGVRESNRMNMIKIHYMQSMEMS
jgi:hypothetical protein